MCAVMLLFAFTMSLVINYAEKLVNHQKYPTPDKTETEEVFITEKPSDREILKNEKTSHL
jgi:hypothetical protein